VCSWRGPGRTGPVFQLRQTDQARVCGTSAERHRSSGQGALPFASCEVGCGSGSRAARLLWVGGARGWPESRANCAATLARSGHRPCSVARAAPVACVITYTISTLRRRTGFSTLRPRDTPRASTTHNARQQCAPDSRCSFASVPRLRALAIGNRAIFRLDFAKAAVRETVVRERGKSWIGQVLISCTLIVRGEVAERLKAAVC
jgi:hypothetical protein